MDLLYKKTIHRNGENMKSELSIIENSNNVEYLLKRLQNEDVILYGCSSYGKRTLKFCNQLNIKVCAFCDSDINKIGKNIEGVSVIDINELETLYKKRRIFILISSSYVKEIKSSLLNKNILEEDICSAFSFLWGIHLQLSKLNIANKYKKNYLLYYSEWARKNVEEHPTYSETFKRSYLLYHSQTSINDTIIEKNCINLQDSTPPIYIYTAGKVGTFSIVESLKKYGFPARHLHYIQYFGNSSEENKIATSEECKEMFKKIDKIKIISMVREPIKRNFSCLMHEIEEQYEYLARQITSNFVDSIQTTIERYFTNITEQLSARVSDRAFYWLDMFEWFRYELEYYFDIPIYEYPFDKDNGYTIIKKDNIELLVMQLEKIDTLEHIIGNFMEIKNFKLESANKKSSRPYYFIYQELQNRIHWSEKYINYYYKNNPYMDHFYNKSDQEKFKNNLLKK